MVLTISQWRTLRNCGPAGAMFQMWLGADLAPRPVAEWDALHERFLRSPVKG